MQNFSFHNPTKIHFGEGQIARLSEEIPESAKVLLLYGGGSIKKNGVYQQVYQALGGREVVEFSGVEPNPKYETLMKAVETVKEHQVTYLLAVGGGSVIDGVKFVSAAAKYSNGDAWDILANRQPVNDALPIGCILTLPATGSESNGGSVVTRGVDKLSFGSPLVRPHFAILDPVVTGSLPERQACNGVVDAFVHVMEQYLTYPVSAKVQDRFAEGLLLTLIEEGPKVLEENVDISVRANIMWSATLALNGLIGSGVPQDWTTHMIGHEITGNFGVDHARTLSMILPAVMKIRRQQKHAKLLQYAERVWGLVIGSEDIANEEQMIDRAIEKTEAFFKEMKVPVRLSEVGLNRHDIDKVIKQLTKHGYIKLGEDRAVDIDTSKLILQAAF